LISLALILSWCVGILGRGYWTPDEPREADLAWRMSWQADKAVPLLAGEPFCEKPPLTYWVSGAAIRILGNAPWVARLPNLLYALATALCVGLIGRRSAGPIAGLVAAAAIGTLLLSYQVAIWLATDAPLLAAVALALLGLQVGFYAADGRRRLAGYSCMHVALAVGFLAKSAAAWMVPVLTFGTLVVWERRWREFLRWELYAGLALQAAIILSWVWVVYVGPAGADHLKVFFWNNLVGRFAHVDAPEELQYAAAHRNSPGKYLIELPVYLWPWTLLVLAAVRRAWRRRHETQALRLPLHFAVAVFVPALGVLSVAATARNIYLAPALPGIALLLGWWAADLGYPRDPWDQRAVRATAVLLLLAALVFTAALAVVGRDSWDLMGAQSADAAALATGNPAARAAFLVVSGLGIGAALACALWAFRDAGRGRLLRGLLALLLAYAALLIGPASQLYARVDAWQDLASIGRAIERDAAGRPLILVAPDETTRAFIDMYARPRVELIPGPLPQTAARLEAALASAPRSLVVTQLPGRSESRTLRELDDVLGLARHVRIHASDDEPPAWVADAGLRTAHRYALPNGRRYALLELDGPTESH
jgi:4-amino-4-deoxy-L-arabinose transferase-like glycosyltransferase